MIIKNASLSTTRKAEPMNQVVEGPCFTKFINNKIKILEGDIRASRATVN
jgi:hypothetical protein